MDELSSKLFEHRQEELILPLICTLLSHPLTLLFNSLTSHHSTSEAGNFKRITILPKACNGDSYATFCHTSLITTVRLFYRRKKYYHYSIYPGGAIKDQSDERSSHQKMLDNSKKCECLDSDLFINKLKIVRDTLYVAYFGKLPNSVKFSNITNILI